MGALFAGSECIIESYRARHDSRNSIYAGCATGAILGYSGGPKAMCIGCASFAAFSALIDRCVVGARWARPQGWGTLGGSTCLPVLTWVMALAAVSEPLPIRRPCLPSLRTQVLGPLMHASPLQLQQPCRCWQPLDTSKPYH